MSKQYAFNVDFTQVPSSVAGGLSNVPIVMNAGSNTFAHGYENAIFGISVAGSSGAFGLAIMGMLPDGTTTVVAAYTGLAATKAVFSTGVAFTGTTFRGLVPHPYQIQFQRAVGTSIAYNALVWGILSNP